MSGDESPHELDTFVDPLNYEDGIREIFAIIRPKWKESATQIKKCPGSGALNITLLVTAEDNCRSDAIVVRLLDDAWDTIMNRDRERAATRVFNERGISPRVHCFFQNGICMDFIQGQRFDWDDLDKEPIKDVKVFEAVAREFATIHNRKTTDLAISKYRHNFLNGKAETKKVLEDIIREWPPTFPHDKETEDVFNARYPKKAELISDWQRVNDMMAASGVPILLCHHDGHPSNTIYVPEEDRAYFVDYEMSSFDYATFDLATFLEFSATGLRNINAVPSRRQPMSIRNAFYRAYLGKQRDLGDLDHDVTDYDVARMHVLVEKTVLAMYVYYSYLAVMIATQPRERLITPKAFVELASEEFVWINANKERIFAMEIP